MSETLVERAARAIGEVPRGFGFDERAALAVLIAIREPTNKMLHACAKAMSPDRRPVPGRVSVKNKHRIRYRAMIDTAIAEAEERAA